MSTVEVVTLACPDCGSALAGDRFDLVFFCSHCGSGAVLGDGGIETVDTVALLPAPGRIARVWRPAWVLDARVEVRDRVTAGGGPTQGWTDRRRFVVPAFDLPLADLVRLARALSGVAGDTGEVPREPVRGGVLTVDDAVVLARHIVVGDEVRRPDALASLTAIVEPEAQRLAATPFVATDHGLECSITGLRVATV